VEQELLTIPEFTPGFCGVRVNISLVLWIVVCPFVYFLLAIVLSVLRRCADSDCQLLFIFPISIFYRNQAYFLR
jgi:hypothetical protein